MLRILREYIQTQKATEAVGDNVTAVEGNGGGLVVARCAMDSESVYLIYQDHIFEEYMYI
jgi:hypothetical protein